jgi:hypothetical protein
LADPTFSAGTDVSNVTAGSGASIESQDEETTKKVVGQFLFGMRQTLDHSFNTLCWRNAKAPGKAVINESDRCMTSIKLGNELVKAVNDGGLIIVHRLKGEKAVPWPTAKGLPILSFEVLFICGIH